jgi:hypothetical protein
MSGGNEMTMDPRAQIELNAAALYAEERRWATSEFKPRSIEQPERTVPVSA